MDHLNGHGHIEALEPVVVDVSRLVPADRDPLAVSLLKDLGDLFEHRLTFGSVHLFLLGRHELGHPGLSPVVGVLFDVHGEGLV